jgi:hypothetical protein
MRKALAVAASLVLLAGCAAGPGEDTGSPGGADAPEPTWSVACAPGETPIEPLGAIELPCLGDQAPTAVGVRASRRPRRSRRSGGPTATGSTSSASTAPTPTTRAAGSPRTSI